MPFLLSSFQRSFNISESYLNKEKIPQQNVDLEDLITRHAERDGLQLREEFYMQMENLLFAVLRKVPLLLYGQVGSGKSDAIR